MSWERADPGAAERSGAGTLSRWECHGLTWLPVRTAPREPGQGWRGGLAPPSSKDPCDEVIMS